MKKILLVVLILSVTSIFAQSYYFNFSSKSKVQEFTSDSKYPIGYINWTKGYFLARAKEKLNNSLSPSDKLKIEQKLTHIAKIRLFNIILSTKVDSYNYIKDLFRKEKRFKLSFLEELKTNIIVLSPIYKFDEVEVVVKYPLYGKGSITDLLFKIDDYEMPFPKPNKNYIEEPQEYSSLIVDLRKSFKMQIKVSEWLGQLPTNINFPRYLKNKIRYNEEDKLLSFKGTMALEEKKDLLELSYNEDYQDSINELYKKSQSSNKIYKHSPSIFPKIYDSHGKLIYSKNMIKLSDRINTKYVRYTKDTTLPYKVEIVGNNPLYVLPDKLKGENNTDFIINKEDSRKLLVNSRTIYNLKKGKIFLLVD